MCLRFGFLLITRVAAWLRLSRRDDSRKTAEILILRHQLTLLRRRRPCRSRPNWADRALLAALPAVIPRARRQGPRLLVTPDTVLRWHRDIVRRRRAARSARASTGRPATLWEILKASGISPGRRRTGPAWSQFLRSQAEAVLARLSSPPSCSTAPRPTSWP